MTKNETCPVYFVVPFSLDVCDVNATVTVYGTGPAIGTVTDFTPEPSEVTLLCVAATLRRPADYLVNAQCRAMPPTARGR